MAPYYLSSELKLYFVVGWRIIECGLKYVIHSPGEQSRLQIITPRLSSRIMQAGRKVRERIYANNRLAWPLAGFTILGLVHLRLTNISACSGNEIFFRC